MRFPQGFLHRRGLLPLGPDRWAARRARDSEAGRGGQQAQGSGPTPRQVQRRLRLRVPRCWATGLPGDGRR